MTIILGNGRELSLNPLWWIAFIVWGIATLLCREWRREHG